MGIKRYELNEVQWQRIAPLLPGKVGDAGRSGTDKRMFVNGCLWILRSGAHWEDLPEWICTILFQQLCVVGRHRYYG